MSFVPVLLCGGAGSRLWPASREARPKQYLNLVGPRSMLQQTLERLSGPRQESALIVCNDQHRFLVAAQLRELGEQNPSIILEPEGRNTAPAIALAALAALEKHTDPILLVLPADHFVGNAEALNQAVLEALSLAKGGALVTFGIQPNRAETGYGYIEVGPKISGGTSTIKRFVEKPDERTAEKYVDTGGYLWNSGMFMFKASSFLTALERYQPLMAEICAEAMESASRDLYFIRPDKDKFASCPSESIDYAVMEHASGAAVVSLDCDWNDLGAWSEIWEISPKDQMGNSIYGDVVLEGTKNSYVRSESRLVATCGVSDLIVIESADAVMVADRNSAQEVKKIVSQLRADGRAEADSHIKVFRPWGSYETLVLGNNFQVKRLIVDPGQRLSLQLHNYRAEHWVVVKGRADVENGDCSFSLEEGESTYIALGSKHRLSNSGDVPVELIEVQSGSYLGEDDIVRFDDIYGRVT